MRYEVHTLVGSTWRSRGEVNAASAEQAARIYSLRSGHRVVRVKPEGRLGEPKVFDFTRKKNPMARKRRKIKRNPRRTRRVKTWAKRVKRHRRKHNTVGRGFYTPAGRAVYSHLRAKRRKNPALNGYAYEFVGFKELGWDSPGWKNSPDDLWETVVASEKGCRKLGSRRIDGSLVEVFKCKNGIFAVLPGHAKKD